MLDQELLGACNLQYLKNQIPEICYNIVILLATSVREKLQLEMTTVKDLCFFFL